MGRRGGCWQASSPTPACPCRTGCRRAPSARPPIQHGLQRRRGGTNVTDLQKRTRERTNQICASVCASRGAHPALLLRQTKTDKASCTAPVRASLCPKLQTLQTTVSREHSGNCDVGSTQLRDGVLTNEGLRQRIPAASRLESTSRVSPRIRTLIVLSDSGGACAATSSSQGQVHLPATSAPP